ncbi:DUF655 domain-containing protein [Pelistega sp. MC2]|uniref:ComEA family DNA-binding protein n=1 Tax=Pelistega sp. MC2 TaxID=1720297 RepID=UPI0008D9E3D6|nr:DUF655 domain-containing protein [Pelistega sp. MC2]
MNKIMIVLIAFFSFIQMSFAININQANKEELLELKGVGEKTATLIVEERQKNGAFISIEDVGRRIKGLGKKKLDKLVKQGLQVESEKRRQESEPRQLYNSSSAAVKKSEQIYKHVTILDMTSSSRNKLDTMMVRPKKRE